MDIKNEVAKIMASDGIINSQFGCSVAISSDGNTAIVGVPYGSIEKGAKTGSAYIYTRTNGTWSEKTKLLAGDGASGDEFGHSVAISGDGDTAIVGANRNDNEKGISAGSAYIYIRTGDTWTLQSKLLASDGALYDWFGISVSISSDGDTAIVGAYGYNGRRGSVYTYTRSGSTWSEQAKLVASDGAPDDQFGWSVAISSDGNTAIVGAQYDDNHRGSAYIYTRINDTWSEQAKLTASDGRSYDYFGAPIGISGDGNTAIVGAFGDDNEKGTNVGGAYIYTRTDGTWSEQAKLLASDGDGNDLFGYSVAITSDGNTAIVGSQGNDNERGINAGSAYIFDLT